MFNRYHYYPDSLESISITKEFEFVESTMAVVDVRFEVDPGRVMKQVMLHVDELKT